MKRRAINLKQTTINPCTVTSVTLGLVIVMLILSPAINAQDNDLEIEFKKRQIERDRQFNTHSRTQVIDLKDDAPDRPAAKLNQTQLKAVEYQDKLHARIDDIRIDNLPAKDAVQMLASLADVNMIVDWRGFTKHEAIDPNHKVSLRMQRLPLNTAIDLIFRQITDSSPIIEITPDYLDIKPKASADSRVVWRVYDLSAMNFQVDRRGKRYITTTDHQDRVDTRRRGLDVDFDSDGKDIDEQVGVRVVNDRQQVTHNERGFVVHDDVVVESPNAKAQRVARMIRNSIEPMSWEANGGDHNRIQSFNGKIVVTAPLYVHQQFAKIEAVHDGKKHQRPRSVTPRTLDSGVPSPINRP